MKYTRYIAIVFKTNGVPNLSDHGFATIMNIIHLEGAVEGVKKLQRNEKVDSERYKYNIWIKDFESKIEELTLRMEPLTLVQKLTELNENIH